MKKCSLLLFGSISALIASTGIAGAFGASFSWSGIPACSNTSPAFQLSSVPAGTAKLRFEMTDLDKLSFKHGGSTVGYSGGTVARGAISYTGPCPPGGQKHRYKWTIEALDANGKVLGSTSATAAFPP